jgi:hypothetical protein
MKDELDLTAAYAEIRELALALHLPSSEVEFYGTWSGKWKQCLCVSASVGGVRASCFGTETIDDLVRALLNALKREAASRRDEIDKVLGAKQAKT